MKEKILRFVTAAFLYFIADGYADKIFVFPENVIELSAFIPPLLGLMWGPVAAFGVAVGEFFTKLNLLGLNEIPAVFLAAYLPYKLWHKIFLNPGEYPFAFEKKNVPKFVFVTFVTFALTSLLVVFTTSQEEILQLFQKSGFIVKSAREYALLIFLNDFVTAIFFGMPIFFILVSHGYKFYLPDDTDDKTPERASRMNRIALKLLYGFFILMFLILDLSGIIYDLDLPDVWTRFNNEILTTAALTLSILMYMLLRYRRSVMTNLMLLSMATVFVTATVLGAVSFVTLSDVINEHVDNDLQKMSVIYRERLSHSFAGARFVGNGMSEVATNRLTNYNALHDDADYRRNYFDSVEKDFVSLAQNVGGIVNVYIQYSFNDGNLGFLCSRKTDNWGRRFPKFNHVENNLYRDRYHVPQERYLAAWSEPYFDENLNGYIISYILPLKHEDKFMGMVGLDIDFNYIIHEIKRMSVYENGYVCLLNKNGDILYANRSDAENFVNKSGFYESETYLSNGVWLKIIASAHDIYADRNNMLIHFVMVMLFSIVFISAAGIQLAERGIKPLMLITEAAKKIAGGDLEVKLDYVAKNELGILVDSIKEMVSKLEIYVYHDKLTGLLNTAAYVRKVDDLEIRKKNGGKAAYAVAVFDANFLKKINDTYGHEAGNELIIRAAGLIERTFRNSSAYRVGGDEFVAIIEGEDYKNRKELLKKFDAESENEYFEMNGAKIKVSVARGIADHTENEDFSEVFKIADAEMYKHKAEIKRNAGYTDVTKR